MIFRRALLIFLILLAASLSLILIANNSLPYESADDATVVVQIPAATPVTQLPTATPVAQLPTAAIATQLPSASPTPKTSWLTLPTLPSSATQADVGAEIYRLVCRDCHGDKGQGLTDEWRATWSPEHQNCWQSKCHASNHPVNGFDLPRYVPAIIGSSRRIQFNEPVDLYGYMQANMPWHNPGSMTDQEYWQLTAFIVRENGGDPIQVP